MNQLMKLTVWDRIIFGGGRASFCHRSSWISPMQIVNSIKIGYTECGLMGRLMREMKTGRKEYCRKIKLKMWWLSINEYPWLLAHRTVWHAFGLSYSKGCGEELQKNRKPLSRTSLVAQWLRICLPMQETWVRSLVREDYTCSGQLSPCATTTDVRTP